MPGIPPISASAGSSSDGNQFGSHSIQTGAGRIDKGINWKTVALLIGGFITWKILTKSK